MEISKNKINVLALNPLVFHPGFQHITEQIFEHLDDKSLKSCREVSKSWQECIDDGNLERHHHLESQKLEFISSR